MVSLHYTKPNKKNQNHAAEREIGILAQRWRSRMEKKQVPKRLWERGLVYESEILSRMAWGPSKRSGYEMVTGNTPDISEWLDFEFYDLVWWIYWTTKPSFSDIVRRLGRWLGVSHRVGSDLSYWILTDKGKDIPTTSVEYVTREDYLQEDVKKLIAEFNKMVDQKLNHENFHLKDDTG